ncbi:unnamed protein product [Phyllotreta striolata]|uniref:Acyltransferase 3 domain-containing protein n=1 Tax=Phyllotreta striolata TaxID=444603 RepID=A0A9N9TPU0_PHYSR|nr:unnamed protein product [Phyllotreta striolata]
MGKKLISAANILLPLFELEDYGKCLGTEGNKYCNVQAKLDFSTQNETVRDYIRNLTTSKYLFDRSVIHRGICVSASESQDSGSLQNYVSEAIHEKIQHLNLNATVDDVICTENKEFTNYDFAVLIILTAYFSLITTATICDVFFKDGSGKSDDQESWCAKINFPNGFLNLSMRNLWKRRITSPMNYDYQKLLSIQGVRLITMLYITVIHIFYMFENLHISNPEDLERLGAGTIFSLFTQAGLFQVSIFFMISSWLLVIQIYNLHDQQKEFTLKHAFILILNRYFRLVLIVAFNICLARTTFVRRIAGPGIFFINTLNERACESNWTQTLLFVNNFNFLFDICLPMTWYLSADFQLYVLNIILLYVKFKFRISGSKFYSTFLLIILASHGFLLYYQDMGAVFRVHLRNMEFRSLKQSNEYIVLYLCTLSKWSSSYIGVILGVVYYKSKSKVYAITWGKNIVWILSIFVSYTMSLALCFVNMRGILAAIIGSIVKPLHCLAYGIGILGMSHNFGGTMKRILENKYTIILSNFTFCVYLVQMPVILILVSKETEPLIFDGKYYFGLFCATLVISYILGILSTLSVEEPGLILQKKYLPQLPKWIPTGSYKEK